MKESFSLIKLVAIVSNKFIPDGGYPGLMDVCEFLTGRRNEASIDIPPILSATKAEILRQHPWIADISVPEFKTLEELKQWSEKFNAKHKDLVEFVKPDKEVSVEQIHSETMEGLSNALGISPKKLKKSVDNVKKVLR